MSGIQKFQALEVLRFQALEGDAEKMAGPGLEPWGADEGSPLETQSSRVRS